MDLIAEDNDAVRDVFPGENLLRLYERVRFWLSSNSRRQARRNITVQDRRWDVCKRGPDFIQKYVFPGGVLPGPSIPRAQIERTGLDAARSVESGESYSQALRLWVDAFNTRWKDAAAMGFDERFRRMWNFHLTSCVATFRSGNCDVTKITLLKPA